MQHTVKLQYFRFDDERQGKFYSEGEYLSSATMQADIISEVESMMAAHMLPGLREGHGPFVALIAGGEADFIYPTLIFPTGDGTLLTRLWQLQAVGNNFIRKVEEGRARSVNTYHALKNLIPEETRRDPEARANAD